MTSILIKMWQVKATCRLGKWAASVRLSVGSWSWVVQLHKELNFHKLMIINELIEILWKWCKLTELTVNCCEWANTRSHNTCQISFKCYTSIRTLCVMDWPQIRPVHTSSGSNEGFWELMETTTPHSLLLWGLLGGTKKVGKIRWQLSYKCKIKQKSNKKGHKGF